MEYDLGIALEYAKSVANLTKIVVDLNSGSAYGVRNGKATPLNLHLAAWLLDWASNGLPVASELARCNNGGRRTGHSPIVSILS
jgi:hypothetical protein